MSRPTVLLPFAWLLACSSNGPEPSTRITRAEITGGELDDGADAHPAVVLVIADGAVGCTGTLIAPNLVLTARHCVSEKLTPSTSCDVYGNSLNGDHVGNDFAPSAVEIRTGLNPGPPVDAIGMQILHPPGPNLCNADIALVVLNQPIANVPPRPIRTTAPPLIGELGTAVGYGKTSSSASDGGTRRRRKNVPVISVGQDLNEANLQAELVAGPGVCAGDSGGPLLSAGGAVIGVAARGPDCSSPNAHHRYTRLDSHQSLIDQAFAAAGATPLLETGTGENPPKLATGEGPCTTGAHCTSLICTHTPSAICTQFCASTACPAGTECEPGVVPRGDGTLVEGEICLPLPTETACEACRATECVNLATTCLSAEPCDALLQCVDACTTDACVTACIAEHPEGALAYDDLASCVCGGGCAGECAHQCGGVAGGGGSAGNGPGGGTSDGGSGDTGKLPAGAGDSGGCRLGNGGRGGSWWLVVVFLALIGTTRALRRNPLVYTPAP